MTTGGEPVSRSRTFAISLQLHPSELGIYIHKNQGKQLQGDGHQQCSGMYLCAQQPGQQLDICQALSIR